MTLSRTVSRVEIKRDSRQKQMKQFFDEEVLGPGTERNKREREETGEIEEEERATGEKANGRDFQESERGSLSRLIFMDRISPAPGKEGITVSAVFTSRGNYIKSFCKGCEN